MTLPEQTYRRVKEIARSEGRSVSSVIAEFTTRGLMESDPRRFPVSTVTGLPNVTLGRTITATQTIELLDEE